MPDVNPNHILTISKGELSVLPAATFDGKTVVVEDQKAVAGAMYDLKKTDIIGFDTETRPSFRKGHINEVSLIQLSTRQTCYLFRINKIGMPQELKDLLEDSNRIKIGVSIHDDFHNLHRVCELNPDGFIDLQSYVKDFGIADCSLSRIYAIIFGKRISKGQRLTNWESDTLTPAQQAYASLDAKACIDIYDRLSSGQFDMSASPYLHDREEAECHTVDSCETTSV